MARKRDPEAEAIAQAVMRHFSPKSADEAQEALRQVFGPMIETMLKAELEQHLGYPSNDKSPKEGANRRNGYAPKTVRTSAGELEISVPRDRDGSFEPAVVPKGSSDLSDIEPGVLSMYARGMSQRDIAATVREIYGFPMGAETVSAITDRVWEELQRWRSRALEPACAFLFVDCLFVPVRRARGSRNAAVYVALAYDLQGRKDVLGLWTGGSEGASKWMSVLDELRARGVEDVLYVCADGACGPGEGLRAVFPQARFQRCVVHLVRSSLRYVPQKEARAFCASLRAVYGAPSEAAARGAWDAFRSEWSRYPGAVAVWERAEASVWSLFACGSAVSKVMYTTNAVESVNAGLRKVVRRGCFPDEDAVMKLMYLRVRELYRSWGEGCHQSGWSQVRNQLLCDEGIRPRIERYL